MKEKAEESEKEGNYRGKQKKEESEKKKERHGKKRIRR